MGIFTGKLLETYRNLRDLRQIRVFLHIVGYTLLLN